jgi:hypothetical protein
MTLNNLLGVSLDAIEPDAATIQRLLEAAQASMADAQLPDLSTEGRFDMAYKAIMQLANVALQANGFRTLTSKPGHHQTMIQTLPRTIGLDTATMVLLDQMRKQRNVIDYDGDLVSEALASEAVKQAAALRIRVQAWIQDNKPYLLTN